MTFLAEIWFNFAGYVDKRTDLSNTLLVNLRKCSRERSVPARIIAISMMFRLLDKFAEEKNSSAPVLYKSLIFTMIESFHERPLREHYYLNFASLFRGVQSIPISLLIDPVLKQIQNAPNFEFQSFDLELFKVLVQHPKLNMNHSIALADVLSKICLSDSLYSTIVQPTLVTLMERFLHDNDPSAPMNEFTLKFVSVALSSLLDLEKNSEEVRAKL